MSIPKYTVGSLEPPMEGEAFWRGPVDTENMSATLIANGSESGPFTGQVERIGGVSNDPDKSTFIWKYDPVDIDTATADTYSLCLKVIHANGKPETILVKGVVKVRAC